jgi:hypothetical protein
VEAESAPEPEENIHPCPKDAAPVPPLPTASVPVTSAEARSMEVPKSAVTLPAAYVRPLEKVVVATPIQVVPKRART